MALQPFGPWPFFFSSLTCTQLVGLLGRGISLSQGHYLRTDHKHRINHTEIHALSGTGTHDPSVRAGEDGSGLRPRSHCGRLQSPIPLHNSVLSFIAGVVGLSPLYCCHFWCIAPALDDR
jgi:hypothetical protein